jgi:hypothetical protein
MTTTCVTLIIYLAFAVALAAYIDRKQGED